MSIERINKILDKISESGMSSLLNIEKTYLDRCSKNESVNFLDKFLYNVVGSKIIFQTNDILFEFEFADTELEKTEIKHLGILRFKGMEFFGYVVVDTDGQYIFPEFYDKNGCSLIDDFDFDDIEVSSIEDFLLEISDKLSNKEDDDDFDENSEN